MRLFLIFSLFIGAFFSSNSFAWTQTSLFCLAQYNLDAGQALTACKNSFNFNNRPYWRCVETSTSNCYKFTSGLPFYGYYSQYQDNNPCTPPAVWNSDTFTCDAPSTPQDCFAQNKLYDSSLQQCGDTCPIGNTATYEGCIFSGCPSGYVQFGTMCNSLPPADGDGQYYCDNSGCSWVPSSDLPVVDITCQPSSRNYLGTTSDGTHKCAYIDGEAYNQQDINDKSAAGAGSCGAGYSEQFFNGKVYCLEGDSTFSEDLPVCQPPKIGVNGGCEYPPFYQSDKTSEREVIGSGGETKSQFIERESIRTDNFGNSYTENSTFKSDCELLDQVWVCSDFELVDSTISESSDSERSSVFGGESCSSNYVCNGDAIQCAHLTELHRLRCSSNNDDSELPPLISGEDVDTSALDNFDFDGLESEIESGVTTSLALVDSGFNILTNKYGGESSSLVTDIDLSDFSFVDDVELVSGSCPESFVFDLGAFGEIPFNMAPFCTLLGYISFLVRLSASVLALRLTFKTISEL